MKPQILNNKKHAKELVSYFTKITKNK